MVVRTLIAHEQKRTGKRWCVQSDLAMDAMSNRWNEDLDTLEETIERRMESLRAELSDEMASLSLRIDALENALENAEGNHRRESPSCSSASASSTPILPPHMGGPGCVGEIWNARQFCATCVTVQIWDEIECDAGSALRFKVVLQRIHQLTYALPRFRHVQFQRLLKAHCILIARAASKLEEMGYGLFNVSIPSESMMRSVRVEYCQSMLEYALFESRSNSAIPLVGRRHLPPSPSWFAHCGALRIATWNMHMTSDHYRDGSRHANGATVLAHVSNVILSYGFDVVVLQELPLAHVQTMIQTLLRHLNFTEACDNVYQSMYRSDWKCATSMEGIGASFGGHETHVMLFREGVLRQQAWPHGEWKKWHAAQDLSAMDCERDVFRAMDERRVAIAADVSDDMIRRAKEEAVRAKEEFDRAQVKLDRVRFDFDVSKRKEVRESARIVYRAAKEKLKTYNRGRKARVQAVRHYQSEIARRENRRVRCQSHPAFYQVEVELGSEVFRRHGLLCSQHTRDCVVFRILFPHDEVDFISVHFKAAKSTTGVASEQRRVEMAEYIELLKAYKEKNKHAFLLGDFNVDPHDPTGDHAVVGASMLAAEEAGDIVRCGVGELTEGYATSEGGSTLDHILATRSTYDELYVLDSHNVVDLVDIHLPGITGVDIGAVALLSDHFPVYLDVHV